MNDEITTAEALRREAAVWIARMHSPERNARVDAGLRRWLSESAAHRAAFERANELWEAAAQLPAPLVPRSTPGRREAPASNFAKAAFALMFVALVGSIVMLSLRANGLATAVGEQRMLTLDDGTRISLNTATRLAIDYNQKTRHVTLVAGEALFEVAKRADWPFVVTAGDRTITALGTSFVVRRDEEALAVTLVEGKIAVDPTRRARVNDALKISTPGERVTYAKDAELRRDHPNVERMTAWRRGQVVFEATALADAIAEMNRYSSVRVSLDSEPSAELRLSGVFRAGDSAVFAQAIAETYHLTVERHDERIVLSGVPSL